MDKTQELVGLVQRGQRFRELKDNPTFKELLAEADKFILSKWQQCRLDDEKTAKEAKLEYEAMKKLNSMVHGFIVIAENAQKELDGLEKEKLIIGYPAYRL